MATQELIPIGSWVSIFEARAKGIENAYLKRVGEHIKRIGGLLPSDLNRLAEMRRLDRNLNDIRAEIAKQSGLNATQVNMALLQYALTEYNHAATLMGIQDPPPATQNEELMRLVRAQARVTAGTMFNLSQTTIESTLYRQVVDIAVQAVQMGQADYNSMVRSAAARVAQQGLVMVYPTGYKRRMDSAIRQNILDGTRALNQAVLDEVGADFDANGVEITAHAMCAPDHLPYQGRQYSMDEYQALQAKLATANDGHHRPIGMWNCRHIARPIILGVSKPAYSEAQLRQYKENSTKEITIDGKSRTRYEWTQEQRKIETEIRKQRDLITLADAQGDSAAVRGARAAIKSLEDRYVYISGKAGLEAQLERSMSRWR